MDGKNEITKADIDELVCHIKERYKCFLSKISCHQHSSSDQRAKKRPILCGLIVGYDKLLEENFFLNDLYEKIYLKPVKILSDSRQTNR